MNTVNAADPKDAIGQISAGGPLDGLEPTAAMGKLFTVGLQLVFVVVGVMLLIYMLWGAIKWITSSGEPEALEKARSRIIHALVGGLIVIAVIAVFGLIAGNIIGLIEYVPGAGFRFRIPTIDDQIGPLNCQIEDDCPVDKRVYGTKCDNEPGPSKWVHCNP